MTTPITDCDLIIFGGTGDLSLGKLLPALYRLQHAGLLGGVQRIIGTGRQPLSDQAYRDTVAERLRGALGGDWCEDSWRALAPRLGYARINASDSDDFRALAQQLAARPLPRIFYLATLPSLYGDICNQLQAASIPTPHSRVVLEKPIGHDLASCRDINRQLRQVFAERNTFRIDHYLGKETVQNLLALRFGNALLQPLWNNHYLDHVQITVAESVGIGGRGSFYAKTGALRDMVQNHLLQVLCLVAMEPPARLSADSIRDEKLKVLKSLLPISAERAGQTSVRGQYTAGSIDGHKVCGFLEESGFEHCADTETFVALRADIHNWRWAGVPFYLRTGKRLNRRYSEIAIEFRKPPFSLFAGDPHDWPNRLVIRLQPEENITLHLLNKQPGLTPRLRLQPVALNLSSADDDVDQPYEAYERLLLDIVAGDQTLFMRRDEVEAAWVWTDSIIHAWAERGTAPRPYSAGSMGPSAALALPEREGRSWNE